MTLVWIEKPQEEVEEEIRIWLQSGKESRTRQVILDKRLFTPASLLLMQSVGSNIDGVFLGRDTTKTIWIIILINIFNALHMISF